MAYYLVGIRQPISTNQNTELKIHFVLQTGLNHTYKHNNRIMYSFEVCSLFTNVPLDETIQNVRKRHKAEVRRAKSTGKEKLLSPDGLLIDAGTSHKPRSRKKKATKSKAPALPPPQVISQSANPWQLTYPAPHGASNMIQPRIQTFLHPPAYSRRSLNRLCHNHQCSVLACSPRGILACRQVSTS